MIIYKITNNINGKMYIGQTVCKLSDRWKSHKYHMRLGTGSCSYLASAGYKYGIEAFSIESLAKACDLKSLNQLEIDLIDRYDTLAPNGYNLRIGGEGGGSHSDITKSRLSKAGRGNTNGKGGKGISRHSQEFKDALSARMRARVRTAAEVEKSAAKRRKAVYGYSESNGLGYFFRSARDAESALGFSYKMISKCCRNPGKTYKGYVWQYSVKSLKEIIPRTHHKPIRGIHRDTGVIISFAGIMDAPKSGFDNRLINKCITGILDSYKGYCWEYK